MPPLPNLRPIPRLIVYYQTHFHPNGKPLSILPLVIQPNISVTHVNVAAIHLNDPPGHITLNDHVPHDPRNQTLWAELRVLQACGIKVMGMLGGAAKGSYGHLDQDLATFDAYYIPLREFVRERALDGLDLDVEEEMSLAGIIRLIDRLKADFGSKFIITLAPVAKAMQGYNGDNNLSGFDYELLELERGNEIAFYNTQFYCGWGDVSKTNGYDEVIARGWNQEKIVMGMITNPENGRGWVDLDVLRRTMVELRVKYPRFGGVMGWEYFNSLPGGRMRPWEWAGWITRNVRDCWNDGAGGGDGDGKQKVLAEGTALNGKVDTNRHDGKDA